MIIKVRGKYQVTHPARVRRKARIAVGDLLEATVTKTRITLTPKRLLDLELARALEDLKKGRVHEPFRSAREAVRPLRGARRSTSP